jgi:hypothetical protein
MKMISARSTNGPARGAAARVAYIAQDHMAITC